MDSTDLRKKLLNNFLFSARSLYSSDVEVAVVIGKIFYISFKPETSVASVRAATAALNTTPLTAQSQGVLIQTAAASFSLEPNPVTSQPSFAPTRTPTASQSVPTTAAPTAPQCCPIQILHGVEWAPDADCVDGHEVRRQCHNSAELGLLRQCQNINNVWTWSTIVSECRSQVIEEIAQLSTNLMFFNDTNTSTTETLENLLTNLTDATQNSSHLSTSDVDFVAEILNVTLDLINNGDANISVTFASAYVGVIDNLIESDAATSEQEDGAVIATSVEVFATLLSNSVGTEERGVSQVVGRSVVITAVTMGVEEEVRWPFLPVDEAGVTQCATGVGCTQTERNTSDGTTAVDHAGIEASLPPLGSIIDRNSTNSSFAQAVFVIYSKDQLFKNNISVTAVAEVMGKVLTATILNARPGSYFDPGRYMTYTVFHPRANSTHDLSTRVPGWYDESTGTWDSSGCIIVDDLSTDISTTCRCEHLTSFAVLMDARRNDDGSAAPAEDHAVALSMITLIGCSASAICLLATVITYAIFPRARTFNKKILQHLAFSLLVAMVLFVTAVADGHSHVGCKLITALLHYFLLCAFCWMAVEGYLLYRTFYVVFFHRSEESVLYRRFLFFAYGAPLLATIPTAVLTWKEDPATDVCWLGSPAIWAFIGPALAVIALNFGIYVKIMRIILDVHVPDENKTGRLFVLKRGARASTSFFALMGTTWIFGLLSLQDGDELLYQYLFAFFNAFSGVWIFLLHCANDNTVRSELSNMISTKRTSRTSATSRGLRHKQNTTSTDRTGRSVHWMPKSHRGSNSQQSSMEPITMRLGAPKVSYTDDESCNSESAGPREGWDMLPRTAWSAAPGRSFVWDDAGVKLEGQVSPTTDFEHHERVLGFTDNPRPDLIAFPPPQRRPTHWARKTIAPAEPVYDLSRSSPTIKLTSPNQEA